MLGRTICAVNESNGELRHLEMPALSAIAEQSPPAFLSPEEVRQRIAEPGRPLGELLANIQGAPNAHGAGAVEPGGGRESDPALDRLSSPPECDHGSSRHAIDRQLEENADQFAVERRPDDWAVGFEPPLGIEFVLGNPVIVVRVWLPKSRKTKAD